MILIDTVYTIGYSTFHTSDFIQTLKIRAISCVVDVRSSPYSAYHSDYNADNLKVLLKQNGIFYRNYAKEFGARQTNPKYYCEDGYLDFAKFVVSPEFISGFNKIEAGMSQGYTFAFMCAEKDPINCHRDIMVAREFYKRGYNVINILSDKLEESQVQTDRRLVELYFPNRDQLTLFGDTEDETKLVNTAYFKQNSVIGYRTGDEHL